MKYLDGKLYAVKNDTGAVQFCFKNASGEAFDLTGWTAEFIIKADKFKDDYESFIRRQFEISGDSCIVGFEKGVLSWEPGNYYFALRVHDEQNIKTLIDGYFILQRTAFYGTPKN